jgi:aspartyl-tRNA(Asn)/glutamyl-tRNA(Gln) amidotransferase subunit A
MTWSGDVCGLVDEFRSGRLHPVEVMRETLSAIASSDLNAFSFIDEDGALTAAANADIDAPFGGVPLGVKELDAVTGWPLTEASAVFADRVAEHTSTMVSRSMAAGAIPVGLTTSSEFGGVNLTRTVLNGPTCNPWDRSRTPGGSSGGSAAAVAGGLVPIATGGDGGGSIRIPAGFCGLVGLKGTFGRIPRGPKSLVGNLTVSIGSLTRSVRDTARWFDVTNGFDPRDTLSLPKVAGWETQLGSFADALRGCRVAVIPDWGGAIVAPAMWEVLTEAADAVIAGVGMHRVEIDSTLPSMGAAWSISGMIAIRAELGDRWPACEGDLTPEIRAGLRYTEGRYDEDGRARIEERRMAVVERMADIFDEVDFVITASNPDIAFNAEGPLPDTFGGLVAGARNNGRLTFPANIAGNPAISVPAGSVDGCPVGLQVIGRHHSEQQLLDIGLWMERERPWPLVAPK